MDRSKNSWCSKSMTSESVDSPRNMYRHSANVGGQEIIHIEQFPDVHSRNPAAVHFSSLYPVSNFFH